jgi:hypothetical protein
MQHVLTKQASAQQSPERWPRAFACSAVVPSQGGRARLREFGAGSQPDLFDQRVFSCGRSCRRWHLGPGVEGEVPYGPGHLRPAEKAQP